MGGSSDLQNTLFLGVHFLHWVFVKNQPFFAFKEEQSLRTSCPAENLLPGDSHCWDAKMVLAKWSTVGKRPWCFLFVFFFFTVHLCSGIKLTKYKFNQKTQAGSASGNVKNASPKLLEMQLCSCYQKECSIAWERGYKTNRTDLVQGSGLVKVLRTLLIRSLSTASFLYH